ncbi:MAG: glycoside hydrolase [Peptococcaceae bacterium]|nr:glycoside hydrolase [Peptococcaceae bacterium]
MVRRLYFLCLALGLAAVLYPAVFLCLHYDTITSEAEVMTGKDVSSLDEVNSVILEVHASNNTADEMAPGSEKMNDEPRKQNSPEDLAGKPENTWEPAEPRPQNTVSRKKTGRRLETWAFYVEDYPGERRGLISLDASGQALTAMVSFAYHIDGEGNVYGRPYEEAMRKARSKGIKVIALFHNFRDGIFQRQEVHRLLNTPEYQKRAVQGIVNIVQRYGYDGINMDFEAIPVVDRRAYTEFLRAVVTALPAAYEVAISVPAKTWDNPQHFWSGAFDYQAIGQLFDKVVLMTYDEHFARGAPGPIASIGWVRQVLDYAVTQISPSKTLLGIAGYGYDWPQGKWARMVSYRDAQDIAARHGVRIQWDQVSRSWYFRYYENGTPREVWFEDAQSTREKLKLCEEYGLAGIALWRLGLEDHKLWSLLEIQ